MTTRCHSSGADRRDGPVESQTLGAQWTGSVGLWPVLF
eukprot:CAMPEP_0174346308 /NCGR_PEP_ID=MMETSP0811_2-20130205/1966_1 /TAXON_ID=73025 ORGANISM="Eutreptiella gymnastica-like, Strain CCMP1594" /NCGR_SAMPLE_ID=MMETSP0811_2 /ASSEMBLY_ACC=CAM_ASM_000667 /LENGTH=37 /DNA_ID= /DNA_START= /DNA_END= /DNA_ORIENTATION=